MDNIDNKECAVGLSTQQALHKLYREIELVLHQYELSQKNRSTKLWIKDSLHHTSQHTTINWISGSFQLWTIISLLIASYLFEAIILALLLIVNLALELYDNKLRHAEIPNRVRTILDKIAHESANIVWTSENYPNLWSPFSPCITMQWTYRDNHLVNLPWSLLVQGDIILVRPGQLSPGYCEAVDKTTTDTEFPLLHLKQIYAPSLRTSNEIFSAPKSRKPLPSKQYRLLETPYLNNLKIYLEQALDRPITQHNQQRHLIMIRVIERVILLTIFLVVFVCNLFRYFYFVGDFGGGGSASHLFLVCPSVAILPLLPVIFPIAWNLLNYLGMARFTAIFHATKNLNTTSQTTKQQENPLESDDNSSATPMMVNNHYGKSLKFSWTDLWMNFVEILTGKDIGMLVRSANILHVLGSVTALGCVDKKGILSWPNPSAEKVFFLHNNDDIQSTGSSLDNLGDLTTDTADTNNTTNCASGSGGFFEQRSANASAEVLDLTHNHHDPFKLHFDDQEWDKYLPSLKPLGLAILLNTCNVETQEHYSAFCSHITCEAMYNENLIPVTNRRCLCELAKEIGFVDQAQKIFVLEQRLSTFRHLQPEMVRRDNKYARSLQLSTKLKFPFPHMFAVIVKELSSGLIQLLSEGTADIILDSCIDYWDGNDLCPLTPGDRKKIQDFYQRSSLTAYCTAFAYRPLNKSISNKLNQVYLELPSDSRHLYMNYRSPTPVHWDCKSVLEPKITNNNNNNKTPLLSGQFYSTDSLLYNDLPMSDASDAESCFHMQCNQIFIGMVSMQYQPLNDMIHLIEQLESACIRFVHFSKENELRSRVFSEKMGLESGWNCHISLLSERNSNLESLRAMSFSAPSAINLEHSIVKFDTDLSYEQQFNNEQRTTATNNVDDQIDVVEENNTQTIINNNNSCTTNTTTTIQHDWQSMSCLTDSTEQSAPINFDLSNRARLPRGIDKIRPHIEQTDNVPLLVSLFTDCTPATIREMLNIMQDYGEIVCIMGSSANFENAGIFMRADASISVEPLYPQVCQKYEVFNLPKNACISPTELSCELNSIGCSLCVRKRDDDSISFYHLVMESRHYVAILWNAVQFWLSCCVVLSLVQVLAILLMLPAVYTPSQILWLCCVVVPCLSVSLMGVPVDANVMKKPQGKNQIALNFNVTLFILWCYGLKFVPTIIVIFLFYIGILTSHCVDLCAIISTTNNNNNCTCVLFYLPTITTVIVDNNITNSNLIVTDNINNNYIWDENSWTISLTRLLLILLVLLHFVIISAGFVYRDCLVIRKLPYRNLFWLLTVFILIILQSLYTMYEYGVMIDTYHIDDQFAIPIWCVIIAVLSPIIVCFVNELIKHQEIMVNTRFQKRARLDFGTKLGMNSPF